MNIAICEDEIIMLQELQKLIEKYRQSKRMDITVSVYTSGEALLSSKLEYDAIFLDISMAQLDGIQTAKKMREKGFTGIIIFLTNHTERVYEAFEVRAFRYLLKPINYKILEEVLELVQEELTKKENDYITITNKYKIAKILYEEILYIESKGKSIEIHTLSNKYAVRQKISEVEKK